MKYLILIYSNPASREIWEGFSDEQRAEGFRYYGALTEELAASGELIVTEALADPSLTRRVTVRDGQTVTSDGPFAETREQLGGYFLIDAKDLDEAIAIATRIPMASRGTVEIRPILELQGLPER
ncbi:MAG TPA: YciI family protein [Actinomycetes bacterium]|nr:YciI family protein [Actinomycetes bacterium]